MSEQDLFAIETAAEVQETAAHFDALHHTEEELPGSFAAKAAIGDGPSGSGGSGSRSAGGGASGADEAAAMQPPPTRPPAKAEGPVPPGSPLNPGVGPDARQSQTKSQVPGEPVKLDSKALDVGRDLLQSFAPIKAIHEHVCAWHFYANDLGRQVEAHHYCSHPSEEVRQCTLWDSDHKGARLIGIEYIISEHLFKELPEEEKRYWHSHRYEVGSGLLVAPGVPDIAERQDMQKLIGTYGKTWHTWQVDRGDPLPYGPPQLMMAFTGDGQVRPELVAERDARYGVSTSDKGKQRRELLEWPASVDPAADHWQSGSAWQTRMERVPVRGLPASGGSGGGGGGEEVSQP